MTATRKFFVALLGALAILAPALPAAADDSSNPQECKCDILRCTDEYGMVHRSGPCAQRCQQGMTPACKCGVCSDKGQMEKPNICSCKRE